MKRIFIFVISMIAFGCSLPPKPLISGTSTVEKGSELIGDQYWILDFTYFYKGKETQTVISQYEHRRDCFEAMFKMQWEAGKKPHTSGGGLCKKLFLDGQQRTYKDELGYR